MARTCTSRHRRPQHERPRRRANFVGRLADRLTSNVLLPGAMLVLAAAPILLQSVAPGPSAVAYAVVLGAAGGSIRTIEGTLLPRWFGIDHIGGIRGVVLAVGVAASAVGPLLVAVAGEAFSSDRAILHVFSVVALAVAGLGALGRRPRHPDLPAA